MHLLQFVSRKQFQYCFRTNCSYICVYDINTINILYILILMYIYVYIYIHISRCNFFSIGNSFVSAKICFVLIVFSFYLIIAFTLI